MKIKLKYVNIYKDRHGKARCYYRRHGQSQPIEGEIGSSEWHDNYARINKSFEHPESPVSDHGSLAFAIQEYLQSDRYLRLATSSQRAYRQSLDELTRVLGKRKVTDFTRGSINKIRDTIAERSPSMAQLAVKVLNLVFECACDLDIIDRNPAKKIRAPRQLVVTPHRPWSQEEIDLIVGRGHPFVRRSVIVLLYTGLRASDAVGLTRSSIKDGIIRLKTQKTGTKVSIPLHSKLRAELKRPLPVESIYLVPGRMGQKLSVPAVSSAIKRQFLTLGYDDRPPMHGLRKNAVMSLIEAGCEPRQIQAITGQSLEVIEHYGEDYGEDYDRDGLGAEAIRLWENKSEYTPPTELAGSFSGR